MRWHPHPEKRRRAKLDGRGEWTTEKRVWERAKKGFSRNPILTVESMEIGDWRWGFEHGSMMACVHGPQTMLLRVGT